MSFKDKAEDFIDGLIGKPARKVLEQVGHALMAGVPAFLAVHWLPIDGPWKLGLAVLVAVVGLPYAWGAAREYTQNVGDPPDEKTLFSIGRVPINPNMLLDMLAYAIGGGFAGGLAWGLTWAF